MMDAIRVMVIIMCDMQYVGINCIFRYRRDSEQLSSGQTGQKAGVKRFTVSLLDLFKWIFIAE